MNSSNLKPPRSLSAPAKKLWKKLTEEFDVSDAAGLAVLQAALEAFDRMKTARSVIRKEGLQVQDRFKQWKAHPLATVERDARAQFLAGMKQLNLDTEPARSPGRPPGGMLGQRGFDF